MSQQLPVMSGQHKPRVVSAGQDTQSSASAPSLSLTYEPYYGLTEKPFSLSADPKFLFRGPAHTTAFDALLSGIRRRESLITLTGEIGTGKTTVIRSVLQHLDRQTFSAFVPDPFVSRKDLLKVLLVDFGVVSVDEVKHGCLSGASRPELSYLLHQFLDSLVPLQAFAVLVIDEAQNLPLPVFEEIRILSDLEGRDTLLQVVLVGQPGLRERLKLPEVRQVNQRISVRGELSPFEREDVANYIDHRLRVAGGDGRAIFGSSAIEAIFAASEGTPRLINLICDRALQRGFEARLEQIEPHVIRDAVANLGLEPAWSEQDEDAADAISAFAAEAPPSMSAPRELGLLSDFAVETEPGLASPAREKQADARRETPSRRPTWPLTRAALFVAAVAASGVLTYLRVRTSTETSIPVPPSPLHLVPQLPVVAPPGREPLTVQVASISQVGNRKTSAATRVSRR